jgi:hypothetical protein
MARIGGRTCGWETGTAQESINTAGTFLTPGAGATANAAAARSGSFGLRLLSGGAGTSTFWNPGATATSSHWVRFYARVVSSGAEVIAGSASAGNLAIAWDASGAFVASSGGSNIGSVFPANLNQWYRIEVHAGDRVRVDGADWVTASVPASFPTSFGNSSAAGSFEIHIDDLVWDDATWPDDGKVVLLVPTAQNSVTASTWQKPGGATTNMHTSVDNIPPVGVAASTNVAQAENQIRQAVSNATANVVFDMTTYTAAGIGASDTINAVQAFAITGAATTAVTKTGSLETTNPTQAEANFGAFGTGAAQGTFPTAWQRRSHAISTVPSVVKGTAPTVEVGTRVANTTAAGVCFVGMYVDYTPAAADRVVNNRRSRMPQLIAQ